jgi:hypothetical protein
MKISRNKIRPIVLSIISIIVLSIIVIIILDANTEKFGHYYPDYQRVDLKATLKTTDNQAPNLNVYDKILIVNYDLLFKQTGLGKEAVNQVYEDCKGNISSFIDEMISYQEAFFTDEAYLCEKVGIITYEEKMVTANGKRAKSYKIPSIMVGDILITKATHSIGFRHGHSAIVVDSEGNKTLESILLGYNSDYQSIDKWRGYPSFIQLRLKPGIEIGKNISREELGKLVGAFAEKYTYDIPYGLLTGLPIKSPAPDKIRKTQCAHLVWYAYNNFGIDLDSDASWLVTPKDIANSDKVEVVQIFGVNPNEIWP